MSQGDFGVSGCGRNEIGAGRCGQECAILVQYTMFLEAMQYVSLFLGTVSIPKRLFVV